MYYEIEQAAKNAIIIEDYPDDKYSSSCLLLGFTELLRPLHLLVSRIGLNYTKIITVYEPDEVHFKNFIERI